MNESNRPSTPTPSASLWQRWFNRKQWPKFLFAAACVATLAMLFLSLDNRRGLQAQPNAIAAIAPAERAAAEKLIPPPVPDDENFAATPFFEALFDKSRKEGSDERWPDDFSRADQWPRRIPTLRESVTGRETGRFVTDLTVWKTAFERSQDVLNPSETRDEIAAAEQVDPATNARAALAVLEALKPYEPVLQELQAARSRPHSRFNVRYDWENPFGILLPHLAVLKRTCQLLRLKASAEVAAGHADQALQDVLLMLRLVDSPRYEPLLISQLVRVACLEIALIPIWEGLAARRWSEPQLQMLQASLAQPDFIADLQHALESERVWINLVIALARDRRTPHFVRTLMSEGDKIDSWVEEADRAFEKCPRDWFDLEQRNYNRLFDERLLPGFDVATKRVYPRVAEENVRLLETALRHKETLVKEHLIFSKVFLVAPSKIHLKLAGAQGYANLAMVACALERYRLATGLYPETLAALAPKFLQQVPHDLIAGQPLRYQRTGDGLFLLYSIGWNEIDDGGELAFLASGRGPEKKEGDWVWRYPTK